MLKDTLQHVIFPLQENISRFPFLHIAAVLTPLFITLV